MAPGRSKDGTSEAHIESERQHIVNEIVNLAIQASKDVASGAFVPPGSK